MAIRPWCSGIGIPLDASTKVGALTHHAIDHKETRGNMPSTVLFICTTIILKRQVKNPPNAT